jgi:hypothetical protein
MKDDEIKNRWREYFDKLFNDESEKTAIELDDSIDTNRRFVRIGFPIGFHFLAYPNLFGIKGFVVVVVVVVVEE